MIRRWWYTLRLSLSDWIRPAPMSALPEGQPASSQFDTMSKASGVYWLDMKFAPGVASHEIAASILNAAAIWHLRCVKNSVPVDHLAYHARVRWVISLDPIDPATAIGPTWDGDVVRRLLDRVAGKTPPAPDLSGNVIPFPSTRTP